MRQPLLLLCSVVLLLVLGPACGSAGAGTPVGSIVFGVTSDLRVGVDIESIHVVLHAAGAVLTDQTVTATSKPALVLPTEIGTGDLPGGTAVDVTLEAFGPGSGATPLLTRLASTTVLADRKLLLVLDLDARCVVAPGSSAPACTAPETCVAGTCVSGAVASATLPAYTSNWATASTDPCKPGGGGAAVVIVGEGQADYLAMMDGDTAQVEQGPQGGHHIWVAYRAKNLAQSGSITAITGHFPDLGIDVGPFNVIFTMEVDEGGFCKLFGLRFQLDLENDIDTLLGHPLDMTVTVTDPASSTATGLRSVVLSQTYLQ
jgi:hypothetical protein